MGDPTGFHALHAPLHIRATAELIVVSGSGHAYIPFGYESVAINSSQTAARSRAALAKYSVVISEENV
jgi:hypothetical protein